MIKNKDYGVSFARMMSMMMIMLCHVLQFFGNELAYWFNTGVQIFLFISGFLYGQKLQQCDYYFVKRSFAKILVHYYVCIVGVVILYAFFAPNTLPIKEMMKMLFCYGFGNVSSVAHLWFIPIILFCYLITPIIGAFINDKFEQFNMKIMFKIIISMFVLYVLLKLFVPYFTAEMVICYCLGLIIGKMKVLYGNKSISVAAWFIAPVALIANGVRIYISYCLQISFESPMMKRGYESFEQCTRVALGIVLFITFYYVYNYYLRKIKSINCLLDFTDKYSYDIYLGHQIWILGTFSLLRYNMPLVLRIVFVVVACVVTGLVIHYISNILQKYVAKYSSKVEM